MGCICPRGCRATWRICWDGTWARSGALLSDRDTIREGLDAIPDDELWRVHTRRRERLVANVRRRLRAAVERRWGSGAELADASAALQPNALTVGFARRIALYKRPTLLLHDMERLRALVTNARRPLQIIFAGKAHPEDTMAKDLVRKIHDLSRDPDFVGRVVFVEDYDMDLARDLVQGCDVWLNQPVRPQEASGTSGMKAAANGVLNVSVLDGWWAEAYAPHIGWAIGRADDDVNDPQRDANDSSAVYRLLERSVVPLFYDLGLDGTPTRWIERAKAFNRDGAGGLRRPPHDAAVHRPVLLCRPTTSSAPWPATARRPRARWPTGWHESARSGIPCRFWTWGWQAGRKWTWGPRCPCGRGWRSTACMPTSCRCRSTSVGCAATARWTGARRSTPRRWSRATTARSGLSPRCRCVRAAEWA